MRAVGLTIEGLVVVESVNESYGRKWAQWQKVQGSPIPNTQDIVGFRYAWVRDYFKAAKEEAKAMATDVDPGIIVSGLPLGRYHAAATGLEVKNRPPTLEEEEVYNVEVGPVLLVNQSTGDAMLGRASELARLRSNQRSKG